MFHRVSGKPLNDRGCWLAFFSFLFVIVFYSLCRAAVRKATTYAHNYSWTHKGTVNALFIVLSRGHRLRTIHPEPRRQNRIARQPSESWELEPTYYGSELIGDRCHLHASNPDFINVRRAKSPRYRRDKQDFRHPLYHNVWGRLFLRTVTCWVDFSWLVGWFLVEYEGPNHHDLDPR